MALNYVGRYATTRAKLLSYLKRKLVERGWAGERAADLEALVDRLAGFGYLDDTAFAASRAASLQRRGYGLRRVSASLRAAGIDDADAAEALQDGAAGAWSAALRFAEKRRIGPFAPAPVDRADRERQFAALMRAGHRADHARRILDAAPGEVPEPD